MIAHLDAWFWPWGYLAVAVVLTVSVIRLWIEARRD